MITQEELKIRFEYRDGELYWKKPTVWGVKVGDKAGTLRKDGYVQVSIHKQLYLLHTLVWLWFTGEYVLDLDHADTNKSNNRYENLREAGKSRNMFNVARTKRNTSGYKGVSYCKQTGKWLAAICAYKKRKNLGRFDTALLAAQAYAVAAAELHLEYARTI
ncbi:hypothetical protein CQ13_30030 [Bradyrhizobium retamae]|uniref:AP2/ERF domain-containing protein n=1 Tax=Bradyrhizobium retamae TaxID=1300035 RepID=A0A0R3MQD3_9BRAD|nr:hypothetical protein CQ13_30030 [Bradyrhizobium retamae]